MNDADASNELYSWGLGQQYVLGSREEETQFSPVLVNPKMFKFAKVRQMGCGAGHVVVLTSRNDEDDSKPNLDFTLEMPSPPITADSASENQEVD